MSRPLVVMLLTNDFVSDPRVEKEAVALIGAGWDVTVLAWDRAGTAPERERRSGIAIERLGPRATHGSGPKALPLYREFWRLASNRAVALKPRVVHCHDMDTVPAGLSAVKGSSAKLVLDFHELYRASRVVPRIPVVGSVVAAGVDRVEARGMARADLVVLAWPGMAERYEARFDGPVVVVDNAPDLDRFSPDPMPRGNRPFDVCYIGQKRYVASLELLIDIVQRHEDLSCFLAGGGVGEKRIADFAEGKDRVDRDRPSALRGDTCALSGS